MKRWILPAALAATLLAPLATPAQAQRWNDRDDRNRRIERYDRNDRLNNNSRRNALDNRADQIERRARNLYENGRLSRAHLESTLDKLSRVRSTVRSSSISNDRFQADMRWLNQVEGTLNDWSRSDRGDRNRR